MDWWQIALIILAVVVVVLVILYFVGRRLQNKADGEHQMIDKAKMKLATDPHRPTRTRDFSLRRWCRRESSARCAQHMSPCIWATGICDRLRSIYASG